MVAKKTVTEVRDFLRTDSGWPLFVEMMNGVVAFHGVLLHQQNAEGKHDLSEFEAVAALVDFVNGLIEFKG